MLNQAIMAASFAGHTKQMTINGINFVVYWGGNFAGPFVFDPKEALRYHTTTMVLGIMLGTGWIVTAGMDLNMWNVNRKRDAKARAGFKEYIASQGGIEGFTDKTDKENKSFRYRYWTWETMQGTTSSNDLGAARYSLTVGNRVSGPFGWNR